MKVVKPLDIFDTVEVNYTVTTGSPDAGLTEWDSGKADYELGDEVKVAADRKKYKLAADSVAAGTVPSTNLDVWIESPLAEYAPFDYNNEYAAEIASDYEFTIPDANVIDTLFFQDLEGEKITVELLDSSEEIIGEALEEDIYDWEIEVFGKYLFPDDPVLKNKIQFDFLELELDKIKVTIAKNTTTNISKCRYCPTGYKDDIGITLRNGIGYNQNNFYTASRDAWGNLVSGGTRLVEDVSLPVLDYNADANINANKTSRLFGSPNLFIADDRDKENVEFDFINIFGELITNSIVPGGAVSQKTMKIEGK